MSCSMAQAHFGSICLFRRLETPLLLLAALVKLNMLSLASRIAAGAFIGGAQKAAIEVLSPFPSACRYKGGCSF